MKNNLDIFLIDEGRTAFQALEKIDQNKKGFLLVCSDENGKKIFKGTLTDGDLRRAFLRNKGFDISLKDAYTADCKTLDLSDKLDKAIELFKNDKIDFLPILNGGEILNVITKKQLHTLLLTDKYVDFSYDFSTLDENLQDYEIFSRPWGFYKTTVMNDYFQSKVISVLPGQSLSLQSHNRREEYWIVAHGEGKVIIGESVINVSVGSSLFIPKGCKHRLTNTQKEKRLILTEVQIGDYFGEDDIIRYEDMYNRV